MFRRKEDGSEELINDDSTFAAPTTAASAAATAPSAPASAAPAAPATAASPSAPAAQPAPAFRPVPPQAAMAASRPAAPASVSSPVAPERPLAPTARLNAKRILTVGPDIQMKGEITTCDRVVIEGMVDATMRDVHTVELAETGALKGTAEVEDAEISGSFEGDLVVRGKLTIYTTGRIRGNITYGEIEIQRGGQISGNIRNVAEAKANGGAATNAPKKAA